MARFEATLTKESLEQVPFPANLGCALMINEGYIFGGVKEEEFEADVQVGVHNIGQLVGFITYIRMPDGSAKVTICDVENSQGNVLTMAATKAMQRK